VSGGIEDAAREASSVQVGGAHYKDFAIQPGEFIHRNGIEYIPGNVIKYVCRYRKKNGAQDLRKAIHYLELLLEWEYGDHRSEGKQVRKPSGGGSD
jgi:hypothetical protein